MKAYGICEKGNVRKVNQDDILIRLKDKTGLFIVADGVGGSVDGAVASKLITETYEKWWDEVVESKDGKDFGELFDEIKRLVEDVNEKLCTEHGEGNCCSTIALLFLHGDAYGIISAGDSRIYSCAGGKVKMLTRDDVWENLPDNGDESAHNGKILSAVGGFEYLEYSCSTNRRRHSEAFMLCSDVIYKFADEKVMEKQLKKFKNSLFFKIDMPDAIVRSALDNKTNDNYSLIMVKQ